MKRNTGNLETRLNTPVYSSPFSLVQKDARDVWNYKMFPSLLDLCLPALRMKSASRQWKFRGHQTEWIGWRGWRNSISRAARVEKWAHIFNPLFGGNDVLAGWRSALSMFIAVASPLGFITKIYEEPGSLKCLLYRRRVKVDEELRPLPTSWKRSFL